MRDDLDRARQLDTTGGGAGQPSGEGLSSSSPAGAGGDEQRPLVQPASATASVEEFEEVQHYVYMPKLFPRPSS